MFHTGDMQGYTTSFLSCDSIHASWIILAGPQWVFNPSLGYSEPETSCEPSRASTNANAAASSTRFVARNYVSLWLEPSASSKEARMSLDHAQQVEILAKRCQWCRVEVDPTTKGWVACVFLDLDEPS